MSEFSKYSPSLDGESVESKREEIRDYFHNTFELFEKVFDLLKDDTVFYRKSEPTRHPMIFYYGHTATFFINKLIHMKIITQRINPEFESLFAVGVDEMAWDDIDNKHNHWPRVSEVKEYRKKVQDVVDSVISQIEFQLPIDWDSDMWVVLMGIEHERIHIETSLVLHRQMPLEHIKQTDYFKRCTKSANHPKNELLTMEAKEVTLGIEHSNRLYGWDNEYGEYREFVPKFEYSKYLVSNGEYMEFVESGGYEKLEYWDDEGRAFLKKNKVTIPPFWIKKGGAYWYRALSEEIELPLDWPVEVNALEAEAFCRYKSTKEGVHYQLPSEAEYRVLYEKADLQEVPNLHESRANLNFYHYASSSPVNEFSMNGIYDIVGNVWQWSRTPIRAFKGFKPHEAYDDFTLPTFDEKHALILGSSWASSGNLITKNSRYAFRKHFYQNAGFRYVVSQSITKEKVDIYESDAVVSQYCEFQYGESHFGVENFAIKTAEIASSFCKSRGKALDLGCATGRASFELAKSFEKVEGIDFSVRFIQVGAKLKEEGYLAFSRTTEGELSTQKKITLEELGYEKLKERVSFWQGDACNLKPNFQNYDLIMATNLIDRLYNPRLFLEDMAHRLKSGGVLVITSPYTWQESSTKKELWLGGYIDADGKEVRTIDTLKKELSGEFDLIHREDVEFVIQETARKYQHTISELSVWRKR